MCVSDREYDSVLKILSKISWEHNPMLSSSLRERWAVGERMYSYYTHIKYIHQSLIPNQCIRICSTHLWLVAAYICSLVRRSTALTNCFCIDFFFSCDIRCSVYPTWVSSNLLAMCLISIYAATKAFHLIGSMAKSSNSMTYPFRLNNARCIYPSH